MQHKIKKIRIESEEKGPILGGTKFINDNSDIDVFMKNGDWYSATAFTYENIEFLRRKNVATAENLNGKYFWAKDMFVVERIERELIEEVVAELLENGLFEMIFDKIEPEQSVWIFNGANSRFSGGVFDNLIDAEDWIKSNKLTGMLTKYPLNQGVFDWAEANDKTSMKPEKLLEKRKDPIFIGGFTTAAMEHYHYENGER